MTKIPYRRQKFRPSEQEHAEGGRSDSDESSDSKRCGGNSAVFLQKIEASPARPARSEQNPARKFSFPFRRKSPPRANQEK
ncbi:MAG: hypothetical protein A3H62_02535 [Candidatus Ryanbacteria bacterium RIFCSPLOWO2_02_FULL_44_40]|nr:MAG: hypothetical protein A3H62_02535 [Candidatus Ryanbacteria bacterium RIFCSPLOWO2_02_FULL_44_40]